MKETAAKRREKAGGRDRDSKAEKPKDPGPEPQDVEMPEEDAASAAKPKELDSVTLEGKTQRLNVTVKHAGRVRYRSRSAVGNVESPAVSLLA